uniref:NADH-ubiquinone oxidoreductase chain 2 n=1 Tax=Meteorus pulchricornis TaxID=51522 RepID=A0A857UZP9_9HYME|nr:NADH dehydrogenase subunit 2 [Meteorus pulchricornis]QHS69750.1 NADH dehydrogenase subunit 2 [Meteorus pulchricornis]WCB99542.1 NADH dehydrogenase subunit 2 [Meteorus pulchricornis]
MMKYNLMIYLILFISPLMIMSINNLYGMWINMELNILMFLIYMINNNKNCYDYSMKYFLVNSFSSSIFIIFLNLNMLNFMEFYLIIMNIMMYVKLGMFPFQFWFVDMMNNLNWISCFFLSTLQKLIPFYLLILMLNKFLFFLMILINGMISILYVMDALNLKIIMSYSSINHMCWMLITLMLNKILWFYYFMFYSLINMCLMYCFNKLLMIHYLDMYKNYFNFMKYIIMFLMFSLGGLPPFFGFIMKWYFMFNVIYMNNYVLLFLLVFYSLVYLYNYLRMIFVYNLNEFNSLKYLNLNFLNFINYNLIYFFFNFSLFGLFFYLILF